MPFDAAIVDLMLPGMDGIAALEELRKLDDELPVIMITAFGTIESAIAAMKHGAFDYFTKPFKNDEVLVVAAQRDRAQRRLVAREPRAAPEPAGATHNRSTTSSAAARGCGRSST